MPEDTRVQQIQQQHIGVFFWYSATISIHYTFDAPAFAIVLPSRSPQVLRGSCPACGSRRQPRTQGAPQFRASECLCERSPCVRARLHWMLKKSPICHSEGGVCPRSLLFLGFLRKADSSPACAGRPLRASEGPDAILLNGVWLLS